MLTASDLDAIRQSPRDEGELVMIVRRPDVDQREALEEGALNVDEGLAGDNWRTKPSSRSDDGGPHPDAQLTIMNAAVLERIESDRERWPLAGDQLIVHLDLAGENIPAGTTLAIGDARILVTALPHTGCKKFADRFGREIATFVNTPAARELNLRGVNARVTAPGIVRVGDAVRVIRHGAASDQVAPTDTSSG